MMNLADSQIRALAFGTAFYVAIVFAAICVAFSPGYRENRPIIASVWVAVALAGCAWIWSNALI